MSLNVYREDILNVLVMAEATLHANGQSGVPLLCMIHDHGETYDFGYFASPIPGAAENICEAVHRLASYFFRHPAMALDFYTRAENPIALVMVQTLDHLPDKARQVVAVDFEGRAYSVVRTGPEPGDIITDDESGFVHPKATRALGVLLMSLARFRTDAEDALAKLAWTQEQTKLENQLKQLAAESNPQPCLVGRYVLHAAKLGGLDFMSPCPEPGVHTIIKPGSSTIRWCCDPHFAALNDNNFIRDE